MPSETSRAPIEHASQTARRPPQRRAIQRVARPRAPADSGSTASSAIQTPAAPNSRAKNSRNPPETSEFPAVNSIWFQTTARVTADAWPGAGETSVTDTEVPLRKWVAHWRAPSLV